MTTSPSQLPPDETGGLGSTADTSDDPIEVIRRWEQFGGAWQVAATTPTSVTISLRRCDGGEEVQQFTSASLQFREWVQNNPPTTLTVIDLPDLP